MTYRIMLLVELTKPSEMENGQKNETDGNRRGQV